MLYVVGGSQKAKCELKYEIWISNIWTPIQDFFLEVFLLCFLRNRWMPSSINSFAEQSRSIATLLISLISSSSRVVVNFFLPFIRWCLFIHGIFNTTIFAFSVPTYIRLVYYKSKRMYVSPYVHMVGNQLPTIGSLFPRWSSTKLPANSICYRFHY